MKLSIEKSQLISALQIITPITDRSSSKPILSNFLMEAKVGKGESEGVVEFSATDYEISLKGEFPAKVSEPGSVCISAKKVLEVCREFLSEEIVVSSDDQLWVTLEGGPSRLRLPSVDIGLYPQMQAPDLPNRFRMSAQELRGCIDMTIFATMTNETRKNLMGVCLKLMDGNSAQWIATDGHRLAQVIKSVEGVKFNGAPEVIVPRKALVEMQRVLERNEEGVEIAFDDRNLLIDAGKIIEDGPADDHVVVLERQLVEHHGHVAAQPAAGQLLDLAGRDRPERREAPGVVPAVVEDAPLSGTAVVHAAPHQFRELGVAHRRVGPERHQKVEGGRARRQHLLQHVEEQRHRHGARAVGNQRQDTLAVERQLREALARDRSDLVGRQEAGVEPTADDALRQDRHRANGCRCLTKCFSRLAA